VRRILLATVAIATAAASATALAAAPTGARHVSKTYTAATTALTPNGQAQGSGVVIVGVPGLGSYGLTYIKLRPTDRTASLRLSDQTGRPVQAVVQQTAKNGSVFQVGTFCGATSKPLRLVPGGGTLVVRPSYGMCGQQPSVPTTGEIHATLR
jgi:hypothetical protein